MPIETKIWIVDNDKETRALYEDELASWHDVKLFDSFDDLISACDNAIGPNSPDLLIADLFDGEKDFLSLLEEQKEIFERIPALIVSTSDDISVLRQCLKSSVKDIIIKPCTRTELILKVDRILRTKQRKRDIRFDALTSTITVNGIKSEQLTKKEFQILLAMNSRREETIFRENIVETVWNGVKVSRKSLDVHICNLRKKIAPTGVIVSCHKPNEYRISITGSASEQFSSRSA